jgi:hypothetical protein
VSTLGSDFNTVLGVYRMATGFVFGQQLGVNDDCDGLTSCLNRLALPSGTSELRIQVRTSALALGLFGMRLRSCPRFSSFPPCGFFPNL